ncbi:MAG: type I DNA topoisomerase [Clostridiaceae bacterium]|nr:type I DNA topoisomerase [Clostridiaceae bacterium]
MGKNLVIVESPAKAKTIKKYLGKNYDVLASMGHLRDLPKSQMGVDIENNFTPKYITIRGKGELVSKLKKEAKNAERVLLATDPDREGEAIAWHLSKLLGVDENSPCRVTFNEITQNAVKAGIKQPRQININLVNAQQARRVLDRILGYKLSPLLWKKVKKGLSAGRVQSVATKLIVDREREIENFVPKEYWDITATFGESQKDSFVAKFYGENGKKVELGNKDDVDKVLKKLNGATYVVGDVKYSEKQKSPSPPFITSTLQQEASRKLGFTAKRTMTAAQQLYEGVEVDKIGFVGLITYMRTDSLRISAEAQNEAQQYIKENFKEEYLPKTPRVYKSRKSAQDAHEAIRPTSVYITPQMVKESLTSDQYRLYKLIWERFVASQMASAVFDTVNVDIYAGDYVFKASGQKLKFKGYTILYEEGTDEEEQDEQNKIPALEKGQSLNLLKLEPKQHFTEPPPRYSEATLIKTMEEKGIGRPSTYAPTISTITQRGYVVREKKQLKPTELGKIVTDLMDKYFKKVVNVKFTADMEDKLDGVEEGKVEWTSILHEFYDSFIEELRVAEEEIGNIEIEDEVSDVICEKCGRNMVVKTGRYGKFLACPGYPECKNTKPIVVETGVMCPKCGGKIVERKSQKGKIYYACENSSKCGTILWDKPTGNLCGVCSSLMVMKNTKSGQKEECSNKDCPTLKKNGVKNEG